MKVMLFPSKNKNIVTGVSFKTDGEKIKLAQNIARFLKFNDFAYLNQVHSGKVVEVDGAVKGKDGDALYTFNRGILLCVFTADCVPVYVYGKGFAGIIHAGWRGFVKGIFENFFERIKGKTKVKELKAVIGACICGNCYEVGDDVAKYFDSRFFKKTGEKYFLDLKACAFDRLVSMGIKDKNILLSPYCTKHHSYFHSYRRNKTNLRNVNFIGMRGES